jgi:6-phospho-3-hexuloisomerase
MGHRRLILDKIDSILDATDVALDKELTSLVDSASRIFIAGAGRSALVARFFAMRLMHGGYNVFVVGEIVTPSISKDDLLIVISGSGETETMLAFAKRAKELGAKLVLISSRTSSTLGDLSDRVITIGKPEMYTKVVGMPMGTVFELSTLTFLEATISHIIHERGIPEEEMRARHANLE